MGAVSIDRAGRKYGRLTVLERAPRVVGRTNLRWLCRCECGMETVVDGNELARGGIKSCGCLRRERFLKHGMTGTKVYQAWLHIRSRIFDKRDARYMDYGGRGLTLEPEWAASFEAFYSEIGDPPSDDHTIERKDNSLGYLRGNCRWATWLDQANNTRKNVFLDFEGRRMTTSQWAREVGLSPHTLFMRITKYGWSVERALSTPVRNHSLK